MVDPYELITSSSTKRSRTKYKISKKRKSNEKPRNLRKNKVNNQSRVTKRSNKHDIENETDFNEKENSHPHQGFTQLIQTKMVEVKRKQNDKRIGAKTNNANSPTITRKRQRYDSDDSSDFLPNFTGKHHTNKEPVNPSTVTTTTCRAHCESKDNYLQQANKRRRGCLCSKKQLDELEFAQDTIISQMQCPPDEEDKEEQQSKSDTNVDPNNSIRVIHSPAPLLLPRSPLMPSTKLTCLLQPMQSVPVIQQEENEDEEENQLNAPLTIAAPLSPAMPLNSTYIAHQSILMRTQLPSTLLTLSTLVPGNVSLVQHETQRQPIPSIIQATNVEQNNVNHLSLLASTELTSKEPESNKSVAIQTDRCSISTQTIDNCDRTHHSCHDVSLCPCVQIYIRSEQLFMNSMALFFRNSIALPSPEPISPRIRVSTKNKTRKTRSENHDNSVQQTLPIIRETRTSPPIDINVEKHNILKHNETYTINHVLPTNQSEIHNPIPVLLNTSTIINETNTIDNNTKKSDGSSIQINVSSNNTEKFKSLVLATTALKENQKLEFNHFIKQFSVRSTSSIDDTTTHLITDEYGENSLICPLTAKVLQAVTRHLTIVSYRWLTACLNEQCYVDDIPKYEIIGDTIYNQHYGMSRSRLSKSNNDYLLKNYAFHLKCDSCQPFLDNRTFIEIINYSGGLILKTLNQHINNIDRQIIILCSKAYLQNKLALQQACQKLNIRCLEPEWLIASIVKFEIQSYEPWLCTLYR